PTSPRRRRRARRARSWKRSHNAREASDAKSAPAAGRRESDFLETPQAFLRPVADASGMTKTQLVLVTAGVAALAGGSTALAAKGHASANMPSTPAGAFAHHGGPGDDLAAAATYLGTTTSDLLTQLDAGKTLAQSAGSKTSGLVAALVAHEKQELADAVTAGRLTQAQADLIVPTLTQRFTDFVNGVRPAGGPGRGFGFGHRPGHGDDLAAAATYLGTTTSDLLTQLQAGKTLAQIAGSKTTGLIAALVAHEKQEL